MSMTEISPDTLLSYGGLVLPLALMVGSLGVPLPGTLLLLAAGALVNVGTLDPAAVLVPALLGVMLGDSGSYLLGRFGVSLAPGRASDGWTGSSWRKAREAFERRGGPAILLTRFLLTPLALPTNLIAGGSGYPFRRFLAFDLAGEAVWVGLFVGLGYLFADNWETLSGVANEVSWSLFGVAALALAVYVAFVRLPGHGAFGTIR